MELNLVAIGKRVREARENAGFTQAELAEAIGVGANTIPRSERGETGMSLALACRIAKVLEVRLDWLCSGEGDPSIV